MFLGLLGEARITILLAQIQVRAVADPAQGACESQGLRLCSGAWMPKQKISGASNGGMRVGSLISGVLCREHYLPPCMLELLEPFKKRHFHARVLLRSSLLLYGSGMLCFRGRSWFHKPEGTRSVSLCLKEEASPSNRITSSVPFTTKKVGAIRASQACWTCAGCSSVGICTLSLLL